MREIIADFEAIHPNIHIEYTYAPGGATDLYSRMQADQVPDLMNVYPLEDQYRSCYDTGKIVDVSGFDFMSNVIESAREMTMYNGVLVGIPYTLSTYGVYYNKDNYAELGLEIPTTVEGLIANAKACKEAGYDGFTLPFGTAQNQLSERLLGALDGNAHEKFAQVAAGELAIQDIPSVKAYGELVLALQPYSSEDPVGLNGDGATADFVNGKAAMRFDGAWGMATYKAGNPDLNFGYFAIPAAEGEPIVPVNVDTGLAMSATSAHPEACVEFLAYMCTPEVAAKCYAVDGNISMINGVAYTKEPLMDVYNMVMDGKMSVTQINRWRANGTLVRQDLGAAIQALILDGSMDNFYAACEAAVVDNWN